jgi:glycosyltransferase involved in cell wall biosynthesis
MTAAPATVIIRAKNEAKWLDATLRGVLSQRRPPAQVIVIDSGSTDDTLAIARRHPIEVMEMPAEEWGYSRAINVAAQRATEEFLVILSAHCTPVDDLWLEHLLEPFDDPTVAGVWGPSVRPGRPVPPPQPPQRQEPGSYGAHNRAWGLSNPNAAVRRDLWKEFPFDERLPAAEDKAWGMHAMHLGYSLVHHPAAAVWHPAHPPLAAFRRNRAVEEGFAMMFPDADIEVPSALRVVLKGVRRSLAFHGANRDISALLTDLRRAPSTALAVIGGGWGRWKARARSSSRADAGPKR